MKKIGIFLGLLSVIFLCVSCDTEQKNKIDHISFSLNGKTIELDRSMSGKEVYETMFFGEDKYIFRANTSGASLFTNRFEKQIDNTNMNIGGQLKNKKESSTSYYTLKDYSPLFSTNNDEYEFLIEETNEITSSSDASTEEELRFYGQHAILNPGDEGYQRGGLEEHYVDRIYYTQKKNNSETKEAYNKYYNSHNDYMQGEETRIKLTDINEKIYQKRIIFENGIFIFDPKLDSFVHYDFDFTEEEIILNYRTDCSILAAFKSTYFDSISDDYLEDLKQDKANGSYYTARVSFNYKNILTTDGQEHLAHPHQITIEDVRVTKENGVYEESNLKGVKYSIYEVLKTSLSYQLLDFSQKDLEQLKMEIINAAS